MSKNSFYTMMVAAIIMVISSCKEKGPIVNLDTNTTKVGDTTYVADKIETPQTKNVLFEEFTGVHCSNCPNARRKIEGIEKVYPGRVNIIAYHYQGSGFTMPFEGISQFDFRTEDATNISNFLSRVGDSGGLPTGGVSRLLFNGSYLNGRDNWPIMADEILKEEPVVNIIVSSEYNSSSNDVIIKVRLMYLKEKTGKQAMTVAITESGMVDIQTDFNFIDTFYQHKHVLRDIVTLYSGDPLLDDMSTKEAGRVYEKTMIAKVAPDWKPENCHIVAFVHNNDADNKEILQVAETDLRN